VRFWCKKIYSCSEFIQLAWTGTLSISAVFGHFVGLSVDVGSVLVRRARKCHISGRWQATELTIVVKADAFAGMLPSFA